MVCDSLVTRGMKEIVLWVLITSMAVTALPSTLLAQSVGQSGSFADFESPIIEHSELDAGLIGGVEVFGATVVDNEEIEKVSLFYRFSGETEFAELGMREIASSSFYSVKVDTANVPADTPAIEYYLQAQDTSGNIVLKGFAFQPLLRAFKAPQPVVAAAPVKKPVITPVAESPKINWLYVALGVLVVGGVAASLDSSGGSSSQAPGGGCDGDGCTVTLTFGNPP